MLRSRTDAGTLVTLPAVYSPQLDNTRDVYVHLPPDYDHEVRRYPVVYMHDGQNLFDTGTSFAGSWHVEAAVASAVRLGRPAIVVGIPNMGHARIGEYSPFDDARFGAGRADLYLDWIEQTLKPMVDQRYRTLREARWTGIAGSSMGGLVSLYAAFTRPETWGFAAVLSPSLWFAGGRIFDVVSDALETSAAPMPRLYLDSGGREGATTLANARRLRDLLLEHGYAEGETLRYVEDLAAGHTESAWSRRFRKALPALLAV